MRLQILQFPAAPTPRYSNSASGRQPVIGP